MRKINKILCLLLVGTMLLTLAGCSGGFGSGASGKTVTITDQNGDQVTIPKDIKRIVVTDILPLPSVLSVFFDSADKIVGMSEASMSAAKNSLLSELYPEILKADTSFMKGSDVNVEALMALKPDVVFYNASSKELGTKLKNAGFNAVAISVNKWQYNSIETLNNWISLLSQMFPDNNKAEKVKNYSNQIYEKVQKRVANIPESQRARVFFLFKYSDASISTSGKSFFGQWWADAIGAVNVANELTTDNAVEVNMEQIYKWNPDMIFITNFTKAQPADLYGNTTGAFDWSGIKAIQNKKAYKMPLGMYRSYTPGVDTPVTLLWLAKTTYPELFKDIDITTEVKNYYKTVFGVELTDKQANSIFNPVSDSASGF